MPRADILDNPPHFTQDHLDWTNAQLAIMEAAVYQVQADAGITSAVNKASGVRILRDRMIAAQQNYQGA